mmetsp:Transcript_134396/g.374581  ORF Transcript_134396/g.374581 Transcript_134396/m.374581 type:complete len:81 (+) Transcript_134396:131-373(+)
MTEEEVAKRCFVQVTDRARVARIVELMQSALGASPSLPGTTAADEDAVAAAAERARRAGVREGIRRRVERIVAGLDEDEL